MPQPSEFRTGCLRYCEWKGLWKAHANDSVITDEEWDSAWSSLQSWLSQRYLVEYTIGWERHCWVDGDYAEPERTLKIIIAVSDVLTISFLRFIQDWLRKSARSWRVAVPTDNQDENLILIYPEAIRANPGAEADLELFVAHSRPRLQSLIDQGRRFYGLKPRPHPPIPKDTDRP
jgi:hypothetical protein